MWKILAIAVLMLAPTAFGAITLKLDKPEVMALPGTSFDLTFTLVSDAGEDVNAVSIFPQGVPANTLKVTARTILSAALTDPVTSIGTGKIINANGTPDLGLVVADPTDTTTFSTGTDKLATYTFQVLPTVSNYPIHVTFGGSWGTFSHGSNDDAFAVPFTITPEPISALLLAVGAAFFARRRVA